MQFEQHYQFSFLLGPQLQLLDLSFWYLLGLVFGPLYSSTLEYIISNPWRILFTLCGSKTFFFLCLLFAVSHWIFQLNAVLISSHGLLFYPFVCLGSLLQWLT